MPKRVTVSHRHKQPAPKTLVPNPKGTALCPSCSAIFERKRWFENQTRARELAADRTTALVRCPACARQKANYPEGILTVTGAFVAAHHDDILHTIVSTSKRERAHDTLCRLLDVRASGEGMTVKTANERLARKLGHVLHSSFGGELTFVFSHDDRLTRVHWNRESLGRESARATTKKR